MLADDRQKYIMELINKKGTVTTEELVAGLNVSASTVRNDFNKLASKNLLKKTYGGAVQLGNNPFNFMNFHYREQISLAEKENIANKALEYIHDGQSIMLDASTTCLALAQKLTNFNRLTVVTNGIFTLLALKEMPNITVIMTGGIATKGSGSIEGLLGEDLLRHVNVDLAFFSGQGFHLDYGLTDFNFYEVELKKHMAKRAKGIIGLFDSSKLDQNSTGSFVHAEDVSLLITDSNADPEIIEKYRLNNVNVEVC